MSWLLVIDSVDDHETFDCGQLLPECNRGTVIFTSIHSRTADCLEIRGLGVGGLDLNDGCEMLLSR